MQYLLIFTFQRHKQLPNQASDHMPTKILVTDAVRCAVIKRHLPIPRVQLELVSVLCIETSHYVSFNRVGPMGSEQWVLFDSMADREGGAEGYNIPEVTLCPEIAKWLSPEEVELLKTVIEEKRIDTLPRYLQRLLNDCYICFYIWPDSELYGNRAESAC